MASRLSESAAKPVFGLIGGIGSGKSAVAAEFAKHGGCIIAGDALGHEALRQPEIRRRVVERWDDGILMENGEVNRRQLGEIVFQDPAERQALEALVFPYIERRIRELAAEAQQDPAVRFVILDAAILLEAGWHRFCDTLIYVHAPREVRLERLARQRGWTAKEVTARENAQLCLTEKAGQATEVIDNSGTPDQLSRPVFDLLRRWGLVP